MSPWKCRRKQGEAGFLNRGRDFKVGHHVSYKMYLWLITMMQLFLFNKKSWSKVPDWTNHRWYFYQSEPTRTSSNWLCCPARKWSHSFATNWSSTWRSYFPHLGASYAAWRLSASHWLVLWLFMGYNVLKAFQTIYLSIYLSIYRSIDLSIYLSIYLLTPLELQKLMWDGHSNGWPKWWNAFRPQRL